MTITVFTDGSAQGNGKTHAKGGIGIYFPKKQYQDVSLETNKALTHLNIKTPNQKVTNNVSELTAILYFLHLVKDDLITGTKVVIKSDSKYSIQCLTVWWKNWEKNDWKNTSKKQISNYALIFTLVNDYIKPFTKQITFEHVSAHLRAPKNSGIEYYNWYGNYKADLLATNFV